MMVVQVPAQVGRLIVGVALGAVALLAIFGVHALTSGGDNASLPTSADAPSFDQPRADQLNALLQQDPNNQDALFEIGEMNFQAARNEEAISWFTRLVALDPKNTHAMTDLGTANFNLEPPGSGQGVVAEGAGRRPRTTSRRTTTWASSTRTRSRAISPAP